MSDIKSRQEPTPAQRRIGMALMQFGRSTEMMRNYAAKQIGIHPSDLSCLGYIHSVGQPVSPKQIIAYLEMSSGTGTALLDRLEAAGYIQRVANPDDRRSVLIVLNDERAKGPLSFYNLVRSNYVRVLGGRTDAELDQLAEMLEEFSSMDLAEQLDDLVP